MIFISYRRDDSRNITERLYYRLVAHFGDTAVFKDVDSVLRGVDVRVAIEDAVSTSSACLPIIGGQWVNIRDHAGNRRLDNPTDLVRLEIETAFRVGIAVIPVLVDGGARMPGSDELPTGLRELVFFNGVEVRPDPDFHRDASRLIEACQRFQTTVETDTDPLAPVASLKELISFVEIRAQSVLSEMESAKQKAIELYRKSKPPTLLNQPSEDKVCGNLDRLKQTFVKLHTKHKEELSRGNFVTAHEIVTQIHRLLSEYKSMCDPSSQVQYSRFLSAHDLRLLVKQIRLPQEEYPGVIPRELAAALPTKLQLKLNHHYLIRGADWDVQMTSSNVAKSALEFVNEIIPQAVADGSL